MRQKIVKMAVAVESPFALTFLTTNIEVPQTGGTFVAGRRRRINNDPYGGEGYVWEDIVAPSEAEEDIAQATVDTGSHVETMKAEVGDVMSEQQSVATLRLQQLKQHLVEIIPPKRPIEGLSLDNIHLGGLQDWTSLAPNCQSYFPGFRTSSICNQEWQDYARSVLFAPQDQHVRSSPLDQSRVTPPQHWIDETQHSIVSKASSQHREGVKKFQFEPLDIACSPWSSLMAHRRRERREMALIA